MDQVTEVFALPVTVAVNCLLCDAERVDCDGTDPDADAGSSGVS